MSFDVIGRREYVSTVLQLPSVLKIIVDEYIVNDVVPQYRIPNCAQGPILGIEGNDVYWKRNDDEIMCNKNPIGLRSLSATTVRKIKDSYIIISSGIVFQICNGNDVLRTMYGYGTSIIVHEEKVYYVDLMQRVTLYDFKHFTVVEPQGSELRKCYKTLTVFHRDSCRVLHETQAYFATELFSIFDYQAKRYYVYRNFIGCHLHESLLYASNITHAIGFDGFLFLICSDNLQYIVDINRWQLIPTDSFLIKNETIYKINDGYIEVYY